MNQCFIVFNGMIKKYLKKKKQCTEIDMGCISYYSPKRFFTRRRNNNNSNNRINYSNSNYNIQFSTVKIRKKCARYKLKRLQASKYIYIYIAIIAF